MNARILLALLAGALLFCRPVGAGEPALPSYPPPATLGSPQPYFPTNSSCSTARCRRFWPSGTLELDGAVLLWFTSSMAVPPLATTSDSADQGILGAPSTSTLLGGRYYGFNPLVGGRFEGRYLTEDLLGLGFGGFFLENGSVRKVVRGLPFLAIPTIDPTSGAEASVRLAGPGSSIGSAVLELDSSLWGMDVHGIYRLDGADTWRVDLIAGFRFLQLIESLALTTTTTLNGPGLFNGQVTEPYSTYHGFDHFRCNNSFYGAQVGARFLTEWDRFSLSAHAQVALGCTHQLLNLDGATALTRPSLLEYAPGSVFTQRTNLGRISRNQFAVVPQAGLTLGYQLSSLVRFRVGYDFLYWNAVARPGDQIDREVNPSLPPIQDDGTRLGPARPAQKLVDTGFWAQGLSFGVEFAY